MIAETISAGRVAGHPFEVAKEVANMKQGLAPAGAGLAQLRHADMRLGTAARREQHIKVRVLQTGVRTHFPVGRDGRVKVRVFGLAFVNVGFNFVHMPMCLAYYFSPP